jgi:hypothetical protein
VAITTDSTAVGIGVVAAKVGALLGTTAGAIAGFGVAIAASIAFVELDPRLAGTQAH